MNLGIHLFTSAGTLVNLDYFRSSLTHDVAPGETVTFDITHLPHPGPGEHLLEIDLVDEGFCWFKQWGTVAQRVKLTVVDEGD